MRFHLEASLRLSADASPAEEAISDFIRDAGPMLEKGASRARGQRSPPGGWRETRSIWSSIAIDMFGLMMPCSGCAALSLSSWESNSGSAFGDWI